MEPTGGVRSQRRTISAHTTTVRKPYPGFELDVRCADLADVVLEREAPERYTIGVLGAGEERSEQRETICGRITRSSAVPVDPRPGLQSPVLAWTQPPRGHSWRFSEAGGLAARRRAAHHPGTRRSCCVLEVCGVATPDQSTSRFVSTQRLELVSTSAQHHRTGLASGCRSARPDASVAAGSCGATLGERPVTGAGREHRHKRLHSLGRGGARPVSCRSDSTVEEAGRAQWRRRPAVCRGTAAEEPRTGQGHDARC